MPQPSVSIESTKLAKPVALPWRGAGLKLKVGAGFSGLLLIVGVLVIGIVYYLTGNALFKQVNLRASAIATNLSDAAAGHASRKNILELDALIAKYGRLDGVAYAYIQDPKGEIIASSVQPFPPELKESARVENLTSGSRVTKLRGQLAYETQVPLLEGQLGAVHIGFWADSVEQDVRAILLPILGLIALCLTVAIGVSLMIASKTIDPLLKLKVTADEISRGHLDTTIAVRSNDEVGDLARSLERMRASLKAAMVRLNKL